MRASQRFVRLSHYYYYIPQSSRPPHPPPFAFQYPSIANRIVQIPEVEAALRNVDRGDFVDTNPYQDSPQPIGYNVTVSAPHMHSYCLDQLYKHCKPGATVLDVGCGSGIFAAQLSALAGHQATVVALDHIAELVDLSRRNIEKSFKSVVGKCGQARKKVAKRAGVGHRREKNG